MEDAPLESAATAAPAVQDTEVEGLLTVIITTSPTPSAPTTELLSQVLESFETFCPALLRCRVIVVLDAYDHIGSRARLKRGQVTAEGAEDYKAYKQNVKDLFLREYYSDSITGQHTGSEPFKDALESPLPAQTPALVKSRGEAEFGYDGRKNGNDHAVPFTLTRTEDGLVSFVEPESRLGFGLAVRTGLRLAETPYVWIHQHDWTLLTEIPIGPLLDVMMASPSLPPSTSLTPLPASLASPAESSSLAASAPSVLTPPASSPLSSPTTPDRSRTPASTLTPDAASDCTTPDSDSDLEDPPIKYIGMPSCGTQAYAISANVTRYPALIRLTRELKRSFPAPSHPSSPPIPLTPLFFWHDKPHLAEKAHYLARIFPNRLALSRGDFIEDTVGHRARTQMKAGSWARWACWMYYPEEGRRMCLRHLQGRYWRGTAGELEKKEAWIAMNGGKKPKWEDSESATEVTERVSLDSDGYGSSVDGFGDLDKDD